MPHPVLELIHRRASAEEFDQARTLGEAAVRELVRDATRAPSSFNIQHWRFLAVRSTEGRQRLCEAAFGQQQVRKAAVTFVILGDTQGVDKLPEVMEDAVRTGAMPEGKAASWVQMARQIYADPALARDEAMRSGSLAAMTMMLAAEARGLVACALTGFDVPRVMREFGIDARYVPVMLLAVGYPAGPPGPRMPRLPLSEVLAFEHWPGSDGRDG